MEFCCCFLSLSVSHLLGKTYPLEFDESLDVGGGGVWNSLISKNLD